MIEANKYKLGIFLTVGMVLIVAGIFVFGLSQFFTKKIYAYTVFTNSVEGLNVGSPVKYNGVTIGKVNDIIICDKGNIAVFMELYPKTIDTSLGSRVARRMEDHGRLRSFVSDLIKTGLRCSLQLRSFTGEKFIGISFMKEPINETKLDRVPTYGNYVYLPSVQSFIPVFTDNISLAINNIAQIDFKGISNGIEQDLKEINKIAQDTQHLLKSFQAREAVDSFMIMMNQLQEMSGAVTTLCNNINNNPSSIIWGNKPTPVLGAVKK